MRKKMMLTDHYAFEGEEMMVRTTSNDDEKQISDSYCTGRWLGLTSLKGMIRNRFLSVIWRRMIETEVSCNRFASAPLTVTDMGEGGLPGPPILIVQLLLIAPIFSSLTLRHHFTAIKHMFIDYYSFCNRAQYNLIRRKSSFSRFFLSLLIITII